MNNPFPRRKGVLSISLALGGLILSAQAPDEFSPAETVERPESPLEGIALNHAVNQRTALGLSEAHGFRSEHIHTNTLGKRVVRLQQQFHGVKVYGAQLLMQLDAQGQVERQVDRTQKRLSENFSTTPSLDASQALAIASQEFGGSASLQPRSELVIYADNGRRPVLRSGGIYAGAPGIRLAYHIRIVNEAPEDIRSEDYMIDANNGQVITRWDSLQTNAAKAQGKGFYNGNVTLDVSIAADGTQQLQDTGRAKRPNPRVPFAQPGNLFLDLGHQYDFGYWGSNEIWPAFGPIYAIPEGAPWGDGTLYLDSGATGDSQTGSSLSVAADVAAATANTWDFYKQVFGWNGIDNQESATLSRLHMGQQYQNAYWSDLCFCVSYGDGMPGVSAPFTTPDIVAHELTHGVTSAMGGLAPDMEPGGLNEGFSDIFSKLMNVWSKAPGGHGTTVPEMSAGMDWNTGKVFYPSTGAQDDPSRYLPLRYMNHPSQDGESADWWSFALGLCDVHYSCGPLNRAFSFLAQGATSDPSKDNYSPFTPAGFAGIGLDKAARITFMAYQDLDWAETYSDLRAGMLSAAQTYFGPGDSMAVQNAFAAINVEGIPSSIVIARDNRLTQDPDMLWGDPSIQDSSLGGFVPCNGRVSYRAETPVTWSLVEGSMAGTIAPIDGDPTRATFTAGKTAGIYHIKALSSTDITTIAVTVCQPDQDGDGLIGAFDLGLISYRVGSRGVTAPPDLNGDKNINTIDLALFTAFYRHWI